MAPAALLAAFIVGLAGSLHCVGMCGPLAMVVPLKGNHWIAITVYNVFRVLMYAALGFVFGSLGTQINFLESGQRISLVLGIAVLLFFVVPSIWPQSQIMFRWNTLATKLYSRFARPVMSYKGWASPALLGMLNGLLPCGLIYVALAGAVASGSGENGAIVMSAVGLGTWPAMVSMMAFRKHFKGWMQQSSRFVLPVVAGVLGLSLLVRGLNLDIPYLSPKVEKVTTADGEECR